MKKYVIFVFVLCLLFVPSMVDAQSGALVTCNGPDCDWCSFVDLINNVITWLVAFLSVIAVIALVYAGFKLVTSAGNREAWASAKKLFTSVVIGIIIVLAAWLIVDTTLRLLTDTGGINDWLPNDCGRAPNESVVIDDDGSAGEGSPSVSLGEGQVSDAEARSILTDAGIDVNKSEAEGTSLNGMNKATLEEVLNIQQSCNCEVTVTGGTESGPHAPGQYSHGNGYKVDLRSSDGVDNYIKSNYERVRTRSDGAALYEDPNRPGVEYAEESTHWDITVK